MGLFGFFDTIPGRAATVSGYGEIAAYTSALRDREAALGGKPHQTPQHSTSGDGLEITILGEPIWRGTETSTGRAASLDSIGETYRRRGVGFLNLLAGRFALALSDSQSHRILLAIDPMGIERLTYAHLDNVVFFGSSAEAVARCPGVSARINRQALFDYLMMHMVPAPATIFEKVSKLRPATCAIVENGRLRIERYWSPRFEEARGRPFAQLKGELFGTLRGAVSDSHPDSTSGAFLSGGLDSSTVAGILSEVGPRPAKTFSIGFGYVDYDELSYARIANRHFGCTGHEYTIHGDDIVESFSRIAQIYDEPFGNSSALPAYYCARLAKHHGVEHLLAGDGGDELFAGNSRYAEQRTFEHYRRMPAIFRKGLLEPVVKHWPPSFDPWLIRKARGYIEKANVPLPARLETWNVAQRLGAAEMLHDDFLPQIDTRAPFATMQEVWDSTPGESQLNHMLYYDWHYTLADNDLRKVEAVCALANVKVSYPMLHPAVVDMSTRVTPQVMMPGNKLRHFYKQAVTGFLPEEIIHKKKRGFGLPFGLWLQDSPALRGLIHGNLANLRKRGVIRASFIDRLLTLHTQEDARYYGVFLWVLAMLEQWFAEHQISL